MTTEGRPVDPSSGGPSGPERRRTPRLPSQLKVTCYPAGLMDRRQARLRDVSRNGLAVLADRRWEAGTVLVVELPGPEGVVTERARVVHATPHVGGCFVIGCVFEFPIPDALVQALTS